MRVWGLAGKRGLFHYFAAKIEAIETRRNVKAFSTAMGTISVMAVPDRAVEVDTNTPHRGRANTIGFRC